jgi:hypothetical protein
MQAGSRENTFCCVPSSKVFWDVLFHGRARMMDVSFHIVATFCIQEIAHGTSLRLDHRMDKILRSNDMEGGKRFYHHVKRATTLFECSIIYRGEDHCQIDVEVHWIQNE